MSKLERCLTQLCVHGTFVDNFRIKIDDESLKQLNPNIKVASIKKYLRNAGFVISRVKEECYWYRWINIRNGLSFFHWSTSKSEYCFLRYVSSVQESKPEYYGCTFYDGYEYTYEKYGTQLMSISSHNYSQPIFPKTVPLTIVNNNVHYALYNNVPSIALPVTYNVDRLPQCRQLMQLCNQ